MKKGKKYLCLMIGATCLLVIVGGVWMAQRTSLNTDTPREILGRIEGALGDEWNKISETEVIPFTLTFTDEGDDTLIYYVCKTTYYSEEIPEIDGLSPVLNEVIAPETAEQSRPCQVSGLDAMLYEKGERGFLCWTISPQYSLAIEYTLDSIPEEDIFRMAKSIPANTEN